MATKDKTNTCVLCCLKDSCKHSVGFREFRVVEENISCYDLEQEWACGDRLDFLFASSENGTWTPLSDTDMMYRRPIGEVVNIFKMNFLKLVCVDEQTPDINKEATFLDPSQHTEGPQAKKMRSAFDVLMSHRKPVLVFPDVKTSRQVNIFVWQ